MSTTVPKAPTGAVPAIGVPDSQDYPRLVYTAPYFAQTPLAELIEPSVIEAAEAVLPVLVPPYVQGAADAAVDQRAVLLTGSTMSGPLYLNPAIPTQPSQAASMSYVDMMVSVASVPEVPPVPFGQTWARQTGAWVPALSDAPNDGTAYGRVSQAWSRVLPLTGGTMAGPLNYTATGATTSRSAQDRAADRLSIKDLGAVGDGVTDDSAAFTAAVALTGPAEVYLPHGTYLLSATKAFVCGRSVSFRGESRDNVRIVFPTSTTLTANVFNFTAGSSFSSTVQDVTFDMTNVTAVTGNIGILSSNLHRLDVRRCSFIGMSPMSGFYGVIQNNQVNGFVVDGCNFIRTVPPSGVAVGAILMTSSGGANTNTRCWITNNNCVNAGIDLQGSCITCAWNVVSNPGYNSPCITSNATADTFNITIDGNDCSGNTGSFQSPCIVVFSANTTVVNNRCYNGPGTGIGICGKNCVVVGNMVWNNGQLRVGSGGSAGIQCMWQDATYNGSGSYVAGNIVWDSGAGTQNVAISDMPATGGTLGFSDSAGRSGGFVLGTNSLNAPNYPIIVRSSTTYDTMVQQEVNGGTTGGTANAQTISRTAPPILKSAWVAGLVLRAIPGATNTGTTTLNVQTAIANADGDFVSVAPKMTGAIPVRKKYGSSVTELSASDLTAGVPATLVYDGAQWLLQHTGALTTGVFATAGPASVTGTTSETNLAAIRIPGGSVGPNGLVEITALWTYTNSANNKTFVCKVNSVAGVPGGTTLGTLVVTTTANAQTKWITRNNNSLAAQITFPATALAPYASSATATTASAINTANDWYVNLDGALANAGETITLTHASVVVYPA